MEEGAWVLLLVLHGAGASLARGVPERAAVTTMCPLFTAPLFSLTPTTSLSLPLVTPLLSLYDTPLSYSIRTTEAQREPALSTLTAR